MRPDLLLLTEMIDAAEQAQRLAGGVTAAELEADRQRRDALLWNFTVLGEAAARLSDATKTRFPQVQWQQPTRLRNRVVHGYWSIDKVSAVAAAATSWTVDRRFLQERNADGRWFAGHLECPGCQRRDRPGETIGSVPGVGQQPGEGGVVQGKQHDCQVLLFGWQLNGQLAKQPDERT